MATQFDVSVLIKVLNQASAPVAKISSDIQNFTNKSVENLNKIAEASKELGKKISDTGGKFTTRLTLPIVAMGGLALKNAAKVEQLDVAFSGMLKSSEAGAKIVKDLLKYSADTPFELNEQIAPAAKTLLGFGYTAEQTISTIKMLGDISAGSGADIKDLALIMGQAKATGSAMTQDLKQLLSRGAITLKDLAAQLGVTEAEVFDAASKGKVTYDVLEKAMASATKEGGRFNNAALKQSKTLSGLFSTLKDTVSLTFAKLGEDFAKTVNLRENISKLIAKIQEFADWVISLSDKQKKWLFAILGILAAIGPLLFVIGKLITVFGFMSQGLGILIRFSRTFGKVLFFVGKVGFKSIMLIGRALLALNAMGGPILWILLAVGTAAILIYKYWKPIKAFFIKLFNTIWGLFSKLLDNPFFRTLAVIFLPMFAIPALIVKNWKPIKEFFSNIFNSISNGFSILIDFMRGAINGFVSSISNVYSMITGFFSSIWESVYDSFISFIDGLFNKINMFVDSINEIYNKIKSFFGGDTGAITLKTEQMAPNIQKSIVDSKSETDIKIKISSDKGVNAETEGVSRKRGDANVSVQNILSGSFAVN